MADKSIAAMLQEEMERSDRFSRENFGLQLGSDYPEMAQELLASDKLCAALITKFVLLMVRGSDDLTKVDPKSSPREMARKVPQTYETPFAHLYWGIQIGRELQKRETAALATMAEK